MVFKFADYQFESDPEFDGFPFSPTSELVGIPLKAIKAKLITKKDGTEAVRIGVEDAKGNKYMIYRQSGLILSIFKNILSQEGTIPDNAWFKIVKYTTKDGFEAYTLEDME